MSPAGKTDPRAEVEATIQAFFDTSADLDARATCRFPARFLWLARRLPIDPSRIPGSRCPAFEAYYEKLRPESIVVVFSSYFMNRAASAFGHTFLRIEKRTEYATAEKRKLLDFGIDYSANVTTSNSVLYAWWGLTGGFRGTFKRLPFYYKVREYNDFESRDLWEYRLDLSAEQVAMAVAHIWELGPTYLDYFYLSENCSYHILGIVEVARPELELIKRLKAPVIPADTIRTLVDTPGLVAQVTYMPSLTTQFRARIQGMSRAELSAVTALVSHAETDLSAFDPRQRVRLLDAAADLVDVNHGEEVLTAPKSRPALAKHRLLERRAEIGLPSEGLVIQPPWHKQPHAGHSSRRLWIGAGTQQGAGPYLELSMRLNLHDLADPPDGYPELSQIEFLPTALRLSPHGLSLEQLSLVRILHLNPIGRYTKRPSWKLDLGGERIRGQGCGDCFAALVTYGGGLAVSLASDALVLWSMVELRGNLAPSLDALGGGPFRLGPGSGAGLRIRWHRRLLSVATVDWTYYPYQSPKQSWLAIGHLRWAIAQNTGIDAGVQFRGGDVDGQLALLFYY